MSKRFVRRSFLYVPGSSERKIAKALHTAADAIILDLEDAVSPMEKENARALVLQWMDQMKESNKEILVRVNALDTFLGIEDIIALADNPPHTIVVPKANVQIIQMMDLLLGGLEERKGLEKGSIGLIPLLETTAGIQDAVAIVGASSRVNGVQLGAEDLTKELGIPRTKEGDEIRFAREIVAYAACRYKVDSLDTPFTDIHDTEGLCKDTETAKNIGFTGKTCIYPPHAEHVNERFRPKAEDVASARQIVAAFEQARKEGKGACMFEGKMIDLPIVERAVGIIEKEEFISQRVKGE